MTGNTHRRVAENGGCLLASTLLPLLDDFDVLLPEQASIVRSGLLRCGQSNASSSNETIDSSERPLKTVDDLMEAADRASNSKDKVPYLGRAAYLAAQQENFDRALAILDTFSDEERSNFGDIWNNWRWDFASSAALAQLKQGDRYLMNKIIASTPAHLRSYVQISMADALANRGDIGGAIELLQEGRRGSAKLPGSDSLDWYLSLLSRYAKLATQESPVIFRELVTAVNHRETAKVLNSDREVNDGFGGKIEPIRLPPSAVADRYFRR